MQVETLDTEVVVVAPLAQQVPLAAAAVAEEEVSVSRYYTYVSRFVI